MIGVGFHGSKVARPAGPWERRATAVEGRAEAAPDSNRERTCRPRWRSHIEPVADVATRGVAGGEIGEARSRKHWRVGRPGAAST